MSSLEYYEAQLQSMNKHYSSVEQTINEKKEHYGQAFDAKKHRVPSSEDLKKINELLTTSEEILNRIKNLINNNDELFSGHFPNMPINSDMNFKQIKKNLNDKFIALIKERESKRDNNRQDHLLETKIEILDDRLKKLKYLPKLLNLTNKLLKRCNDDFFDISRPALKSNELTRQLSKKNRNVFQNNIDLSNVSNNFLRKKYSKLKNKIKKIKSLKVPDRIEALPDEHEVKKSFYKLAQHIENAKGLIEMEDEGLKYSDSKQSLQYGIDDFEYYIEQYKNLRLDYKNKQKSFSAEIKKEKIIGFIDLALKLSKDIAEEIEIYDSFNWNGNEYAEIKAQVEEIKNSISFNVRRDELREKKEKMKSLQDSFNSLKNAAAQSFKERIDNELKKLKAKKKEVENLLLNQNPNDLCATEIKELLRELDKITFEESSVYQNKSDSQLLLTAIEQIRSKNFEIDLIAKKHELELRSTKSAVALMQCNTPTKNTQILNNSSDILAVLNKLLQVKSFNMESLLSKFKFEDMSKETWSGLLEFFSNEYGSHSSPELTEVKNKLQYIKFIDTHINDEEDQKVYKNFLGMPEIVEAIIKSQKNHNWNPNTPSVLNSLKAIGEKYNDFCEVFERVEMDEGKLTSLKERFFLDLITSIQAGIDNFEFARVINQIKDNKTLFHPYFIIAISTDKSFFPKNDIFLRSWLANADKNKQEVIALLYDLYMANAGVKATSDNYYKVKTDVMPFVMNLNGEKYNFMGNLNSYNNENELKTVITLVKEVNTIFEEAKNNSPEYKNLIISTHKSVCSELLNHNEGTKTLGERCGAVKKIIHSQLKPRMAESIWGKIQRALINVGIVLSFGMVGVARVINKQSFWAKRGVRSIRAEDNYKTVVDGVEGIFEKN